MVSLTADRPVTLFEGLRARWAEFSARRAEDRRLATELSTYRTPAERAEIEAMLTRAYEDGADPADVDHTLRVLQSVSRP
jgi:hypothetical protein